jgi:hypothetical protein
MSTVFWWENLNVRNHSEDLGIDGNIILNCILGKLSQFLLSYNRLATFLEGVINVEE